MRATIGGLVDGALDRSVIAGYTRFGYTLRHRVWSSPELPSLEGREIAITGATAGIGLAAAELAASHGARVRLLVRDARRGERVAKTLIARTGNEAVSVVLCDLASLRSVRACAATLRREQTRLDVLVNNAGVLPAERSLSPDGYELTFATNVLGPYLLTGLLVPLLERTAGRVITVSSGGMYTQRLAAWDLEMQRRDFDGVVADARAKRAQVVLSEMWAHELAARHVSTHAMHPGWVDTPGVQTSLPRFRRVLGPALRTPEQGADTIVWLCGAPADVIGSGRFWHDRRPRPTHLLPGTRETPQERCALWSTLTRMVAAHQIAEP
jgi:NAD(P)-dependent dehydrogenase (short-subunit alcohol dehydrogenase family)